MRPRSQLSARWLLLAVVPLFALLLYGSASAAPPTQAPTCRWTKLANGDSRTEVTLVTLPGKGVLAYGGADLRSGQASVKDDVHQLDLSSGTGTWRELTPSGSGPGDRAEHSSVLRSGQSSVQMVTYGGIDTVPQGGGTAAWQSPLLADGSAADSRLGAFAPLDVQKDTYILDIDAAGSAAWVKVGPAGQPRTEHSAVYDPEADAMVIFGGRRTEEGTSAENSTWRLTLGASPAWESLSGGGAPPSKRFAHTAVFDPVGKRMIVFGGTIDWRSGENDSYALDLSEGWDNATWSKLTPSGTPPPARYNHAATYVPELQWMVVYGGTRNGNSQYNDGYALDLSSETPAWIELPFFGTRPPDLQSQGAAYSDASGAAVFYGGQSGRPQQRASTNQAWSLKCDSGAPTATPTTPAAPTTPTPPTEPATATPTATEGLADVTVTGLVSDASGGPSVPVVGATVAIGLSVPRQPFTAVTGADGRYSVTVPSIYVASINEISVSATGYVTVAQPVTGAELAANPIRDFALERAPTHTPVVTTVVPTPDTPTPTATGPIDKYFVYAPIILKGYVFPGR
jgi:hypothetical protein